MTIHESVLELIGHTPMLRTQRLDTGACSLFLKLENTNPGGSIKDRIGRSMIEAAERDGRLQPGATLVEGTAGNTGIGLALAARAKGYPLILVVPDKMSREKIATLQAMGVEVRITRSDVAKGHPEYYQDMALRLAEETPGAFFVNQFGNPDNPRTHHESTGPEILEQMDGRVDALVVGCGSSGTMTGLSRYFAEHSPDTEIILADPVGSILARYINEGEISTKSGSWMVEGIGEDFLPSIADFSRIRKAYTITDRESFLTARELLEKEGILGGSTTGALVATALRWCSEQDQHKRVVTLVPDTGNKYLSKFYDDDWMADHGFIERTTHGDLRDLIGHPWNGSGTRRLSPDDSIALALGRLQQYATSQLPVLEGERIVGLVSEAVLLQSLAQPSAALDAPVSSLTLDPVTTLPPQSDIAQVTALLQEGCTPAVVEGQRFLGLISRTDLLRYLQKKAR